MKPVGLEVFSFETTWYGKTPHFAPALSFLGLKDKPKRMLIFFLAVYNNVMILLSPAPLREAFSLLWLCATDIHNTLIPLEKKKKTVGETPVRGHVTGNSSSPTIPWRGY